jgi:hypothetical protein
MNNFVILFLLTAAAALESGGDALARSGLHAASPGMKLLFLLLAALVLFVYGVTVNLPPCWASMSHFSLSSRRPSIISPLIKSLACRSFAAAP